MNTLSQITKHEAAQQSAEGGPDARLIEQFTRRETPAERARRIRAKRVEFTVATTWRRAWAIEES